MKNSMLTAALVVLLVSVPNASAKIGHSHGHQGHATVCEPAPVAATEVTYEEVTCKSCKAVPDKKRISKTVYSCKTEDFCLPKCSKISLFGHGDCCAADCGACPSCEQPRSRKVLIKKVKTEEKDGIKCVVEETKQKVPVCRPAGASAHGHAGGVHLRPAPETLPAPTSK